MVTQVEIARRLNLDVSSVNKILNRRQGPVFRKETVKKVFRLARELGYDFAKLKHTHRRRYERRDVTIAAEIAFVSKDGTIHDQGIATIRDISESGARLTDLAMPLGTMPTEPFTISLRPMVRPLERVEFNGHIVRLRMNGQTTLGVEFDRVDSAAVKKLRKL